MRKYILALLLLTASCRSAGERSPVLDLPTLSASLSILESTAVGVGESFRETDPEKADRYVALAQSIHASVDVLNTYIAGGQVDGSAVDVVKALAIGLEPYIIGDDPSVRASAAAVRGLLDLAALLLSSQQPPVLLPPQPQVQ